MAETPSSSFEFGPFRLDAEKSVLWRGGDVVPLTPKALGLLRVLVEHGGDVVPKQELLARVWPDTVVEEANLSVTVAALRKLLGKQTDGRSYIQTVPRRGYRFDAPVKGPASASRTSLAVLPFKCLGPDPELHLGLGMADAIIGRLTAIEGLLVRPTGAVIHYSTAPREPREAGRELGVDAVVEGTIQRHAGRIRVSVHLVPRSVEARPWSDSYDAELTDIFAVQDAVSERIAEALQRRLDAPERAASGPRHTPKLEAYESYLRGRYFWARFDSEGIGKAFASFGEAAAMDPAYAAPQAGLADAYLVLGFTGMLRPKEAWQLAGECADKALERDPALAEAHVSRAFVTLFRDWAWGDARRALVRAVALSPGAPAVHQWLGLFLAIRGDAAGARREIARAREADPLSGVTASLQGFVHEIAGEHEPELELARQAVELRPDRFLGHWSLGIASLRSGRDDEGVAALRRALELTAGSPLMKSVLAWGLAETDRHEEARTLLNELDAMAEHVFVSPYQRAAIHVALGEADRASELLELASAEKDPWIVLLRIDPMFAEPRAAGQLDDLLARVFRETD